LRGERQLEQRENQRRAEGERNAERDQHTTEIVPVQMRRLAVRLRRTPLLTNGQRKYRHERTPNHT
jgi:hypothetical protein